MVNVGDRVVLESEKVGQPEHGGVVTDVHGSIVQIRWDDGHESSLVPSAGALRVLGPRHEETRAP